MKPETFYARAPFMTAVSIFAVGILVYEVHPLAAGIIAAAYGFAYDWLDRKLS
ncbi:hypothetical protein QN224_29960 [Sinorhizobium sp. 8-89]|uniref:hypothetical protein n=1 Tax=Sinorhizobium sp. 7-81 TaxID=3049087 RepID=UPI0024C34E9B|nr:hypothetical protein [Sinorhizobium sp. 7-81]MDK1389609.1 hypothetical protein [Sinorhizobium sp. 7-81]